MGKRSICANKITVSKMKWDSLHLPALAEASAAESFPFGILLINQSELPTIGPKRGKEGGGEKIVGVIQCF